MALAVSACGGNGSERADTGGRGAVAGEGVGDDRSALVPLPALLDVPELDAVVDEAGARPTFSWSTADRATTYQLTVRDPDGATRWAWSGTGTTVALGGGPEPLPDGAPGVRLDGPATWEVLALADDGTVVAASTEQEVAP